MPKTAVIVKEANLEWPFDQVDYNLFISYLEERLKDLKLLRGPEPGEEVVVKTVETAADVPADAHSVFFISGGMVQRAQEFKTCHPELNVIVCSGTAVVPEKVGDVDILPKLFLVNADQTLRKLV